MLGIPRPQFSSAFLAALLTPALFALAMLAPGGAAAASGSEGSLTPELEQLSTPALAEASPEAQAEAIGVPVEGPGSLSREGERVVVEAHFEEGALQRLEALEEAGAKILLASRQYQTVALSVEPAELEAIAEVPGIAVVAASREPVFYAVEGATENAAVNSNGRCEGGSVISRGVTQLNVEGARAAFGARGAGETIGVLSDSFDTATESEAVEGAPVPTHAREDEISNDLPGRFGTCSGQQVPVNVLEDGPSNSTDEGRAMLQVIHDVAPHAELAFATAYSTELQFARNIERLAEPVSRGGAGAKVIVDDVSYFGEPFFQEGPVAAAIQKVTAIGVTYLTAAGNNNLFETGTKREIGSWERAEFADTKCPTSFSFGLIVREGASSCLNFSPTGNDPTFGITVAPNSTMVVDLQWAEPWYGVESDLNAFLLNEANQVIYNHPVNNISQGGEGEGEESFPAPTELLSYENKSTKAVKVQLVIDRCIHNCNPVADVSTKPRVKFELLENGSNGVSAIEYPQSNVGAGIVVGPTIYGHAGSTEAITLGAVLDTETRSEPKEPERYSSRGPVTHYFEPVDGITPAEPITPEVIEKPDLTATDCASTTFFAQIFPDGAYHFCGTSEAAPHAAAVAALMQQVQPLLSPLEIRKAMEESATGFTTVTSPAAVGAGLLEAKGALAAVEGTPVVDPPSVVVPALEGEEPVVPEQKEIPITPSPPTPAPAPVVSVTKGPASVVNESRPTFEFSASQQVAFTCQIDGSAPQSCSSPYVAPSALEDGQHGFAVIGTDAEGRSGASNTYYFTVDTKAPRARIVGHPAKLVKTAKSIYAARFRLTADQSPVTYYCQMDREPLRICGASATMKVKPGIHVLKVNARDALGNTSVSPATYRFRVKKTPPARSAR
jgi:subtilisin family serine protease